MSRWWWVFAVGCGQDYCERAAKADEDCGVTVSGGALDTCRDALDACTDDDVQRIDAWYACTEAAGATACDPSAEALGDGLDCVGELDGLTDACDVSRTGSFGR